MMAHPLVINKHHDPVGYDVYVGRPSKWGNPFCIGDVYQGVKLDRDAACNAFEDWLLHSNEGQKLLDNIQELEGKVLACWCAPARCHADLLAELANGEHQ